MDFQFLEVLSQDRGVTQVFLNRPDVHNAFNSDVMNELKACFVQLKQQTDLRLVVLRGRGRSFSAGADIESMKSLKDKSEEDNRRESLELSSMFAAIANLPVPVLGVVQGAALGGGAGLATVCDYVIAGPRARFGFTEARLGIVPAVISPYVIAKIGKSWARALFTSGQRFGPERALAMGLIHQIEQDEESLERRVNELIADFLSCGPEAARACKQLIEEVGTYDSAEARDAYTSSLIARVRVSSEGQEGLSAFLEKRKPAWIC